LIEINGIGKVAINMFCGYENLLELLWNNKNPKDNEIKEELKNISNHMNGIRLLGQVNIKAYSKKNEN